jgi:hypothetical protein
MIKWMLVVLVGSACLAPPPDNSCDPYDDDGDGFPGPGLGVSTCCGDCLPLDCNDQDPAIHPDDFSNGQQTPDEPGDGIDSNCNGAD